MTDGWRNGTRLPTHRQLADELHLSVQTVSRAYEELIRRGLVSGEIGRGSFVPDAPPRAGAALSAAAPWRDHRSVDPEAGLRADASGEAEGGARLAGRRRCRPASALSFRPNVVFPRHRAVAVEWLKQCGLTVSPLNVTLTNGATAGMTVALMSAAPPGSTAATEAIGHHTLVPLATYLGFQPRRPAPSTMTA